MDLLFIGFLRWNNYSIVLGHHDNHSFSLHLMQLCYLSLFMILFPLLHSLPDMLRQLRSLFTSLPNLCLYMCLTGICFFLTRSFTVLHPFLDADNRHYAQKYYKYVISRPHVHQWMSPVYSLCMYLLWGVFRQKRIEWVITWIACSAAVLVLSPLFELRYFMVPAVMAAIDVNPTNSKSKWLNIVYFLTVNAAVLWVFVQKPFVNLYMDGELSRFFW